MSRFLLVVSFCISFISSAAWAQGSLFVSAQPSDRALVPAHDPSHEPFAAPRWRGVQPRKERPHFHLGAVDYRFSTQGIKARFQYGDVSAMAQIGHAGTRLEITSPALARNSTLAVIRDDGGLRVEIALSF
jgi:hypothetical protein